MAYESQRDSEKRYTTTTAFKEAQRRYRRSDKGGLVRRRKLRLRRERLAGLQSELPPGYEELVFAVFGKRCVACGSDDDVVLDHHHPLKAGHPLLHNAVPLCRRCNAKKCNKPPSEFYDGWKLAEIAVLLWEARLEATCKFETGAAPC
jgi:5-methylcytosine-specific restriction endonuclease McrA